MTDLRPFLTVINFSPFCQEIIWYWASSKASSILRGVSSQEYWISSSVNPKLPISRGQAWEEENIDKSSFSSFSSPAALDLPVCPGETSSGPSDIEQWPSVVESKKSSLSELFWWNGWEPRPCEDRNPSRWESRYRVAKFWIKISSSWGARPGWCWCRWRTIWGRSWCRNND